MAKVLTLNLDEINKQNFSALSLQKMAELLKENVVIKESDNQKIMQSSWTTTSSEIRKFIENTFGICFTPDKTDHYSHNRNKLNEAIRNAKLGKTKRGQKSTINFYEYCKLVTSDEFIKFITTNLQKDKPVSNEKKMYEELMYLQVNKYQQSSLYIQKKARNYSAIAFALSITTNLAEVLRPYYSLYFELNQKKIDYHHSKLTDEQKIILDIVSYRFKQSDITVYKFDSHNDIETTNDEQIIKWFIKDIDRWDNEITNGDLS